MSETTTDTAAARARAIAGPCGRVIAYLAERDCIEADTRYCAACKTAVAIAHALDTQRTTDAATIARLTALLAEVRNFAMDRVDADCTGDPPTFVGNDWSTVVTMIDEGRRR